MPIMDDVPFTPPPLPDDAPVLTMADLAALLGKLPGSATAHLLSACNAGGYPIIEALRGPFPEVVTAWEVWRRKLRPAIAPGEDRNMPFPNRSVVRCSRCARPSRRARIATPGWVSGWRTSRSASCARPLRRVRIAIPGTSALWLPRLRCKLPRSMSLPGCWILSRGASCGSTARIITWVGRE